VSKILYLDGCSYTFGQGLDTSERLEHLFTVAGYTVINKSRSGKSNMAICLDTYNHADMADVLVLGFTYSSRYYLSFEQRDIDLVVNRYNLDSGENSELEDEYVNLHKSFYTLFDQNHWNNLSDMLIDNTINSLSLKNKKLFAFTWESRQTKQKLYHPLFVRTQRLPDGHLNAVGTKKLFDVIQNSLGDA
jgi:hypothetical protein